MFVRALFSDALFSDSRPVSSNRPSVSHQLPAPRQAPPRPPPPTPTNPRQPPSPRRPTLSPEGTILCQHGDDECSVNLIEGCTKSLYPDVLTYMDFAGQEVRVRAGTNVIQLANHRCRDFTRRQHLVTPRQINASTPPRLHASTPPRLNALTSQPITSLHRAELPLGR